MAGRETPAIRAVLVDDEPLACDELAFLLKDLGGVEVIGSGRNGNEAIDLIETLEPDLVFLDVQMPGLTGLGVVKKLKTDGVLVPLFVLVTAYDHYAVEAFDEQALDYLLKPVDKERLAETVERARRALQESARPAPPPEPHQKTHRSRILIKTNNRNFIVDASDVVYATINDGLITVVSTRLEGQSNYRTIEELQSNLDAETFWRVHRSFLVNINHIKEVIPWFKSSYQLRMDDKNQTEIPVSRVQTKRLRSLFRL